ncbi:MAG: DUF2244 domain-containing protein [Geminicoccaceae bacterium]|nr:DUF2244 domain-containing protein [Geminicoccaceae bacterium]
MPPSAPFEATLYPNGPLPAQGFWLLACGTLLASSAIGGGFFLAGAWPVAGIMGVEVPLFVVLLAYARRTTRRRELVRLDEEGLHIQAIDPYGRTRRWRFEPSWTRVHMDDPPRRASRLVVTSRGQSLALGHFLTPEEKLDFARALKAALRDYRPF